MRQPASPGDFLLQRLVRPSYLRTYNGLRKPSLCFSPGHTVLSKERFRFRSSTLKLVASLEMSRHSIKTFTICHWEETSSRMCLITGTIKIVTSSRRPKTLEWSLVLVSSLLPKKEEVPLVREISVLPNVKVVVLHMDPSPDASASQLTTSWDYWLWKLCCLQSYSKIDWSSLIQRRSSILRPHCSRQLWNLMAQINFASWPQQMLMLTSHWPQKTFKMWRSSALSSLICRICWWLTMYSWRKTLWLSLNKCLRIVLPTISGTVRWAVLSTSSVSRPRSRIPSRETSSYLFCRLTMLSKTKSCCNCRRRPSDIILRTCAAFRRRPQSCKTTEHNI